MTAASWTIVAIAIGIVAVLAWNAFGGNEDLDRLRGRLRRRGG
jgi:tryptophan-rich sensory protein